MEENYTVYMHTTPDGKRYVGITRRVVIKRWESGCGYRRNVLFSKAISTFGWENIRHDILAVGLSKEEAADMEKKCIASFDLTNPEFGYNRSTGGSIGSVGFHHTDEAKEKISVASRGRVWSEESRMKMSLAQKGKKETEETRRKQSELRKATPLTIKQKAALAGGRPDRKPVWCEETKMIYASGHEAAEILNIDRANLLRHLKGITKSIKGYHLCWV